MAAYFTSRELSICALFGALIFLEAFILGSAVISVTGIPATGSLLNVFFGLFFLSIGVRLVPRFGSATIMATLEGILTIPTVINGPPGVQKILMMFLLGLIFDIIIYLSKGSNRGYIIGGAVGGAGIVTFIYASLVLLGLPGAAQLQVILIPLIIANIILGGTGAYAGLWIFEKKLKHRGFIKQLSR
jgi:hypothetical protein